VALTDLEKEALQLVATGALNTLETVSSFLHYKHKLPKEEARALVEKLIKEGYLTARKEKTVRGEMTYLSPTEKGWQVLGGREKVLCQHYKKEIEFLAKSAWEGTLLPTSEWTGEVHERPLVEIVEKAHTLGLPCTNELFEEAEKAAEEGRKVIAWLEENSPKSIKEFERALKRLGFDVKVKKRSKDTTEIVLKKDGKEGMALLTCYSDGVCSLMLYDELGAHMLPRSFYRYPRRIAYGVVLLATLNWSGVKPEEFSKPPTKRERRTKKPERKEEAEESSLEGIEVPVEVHGEKTEMPLEEVAEMEVPPEEEGLRFIRQKLRDAYVGKFLLHGFKEDEIRPPMELIDRLAREVYEGRLKQVKAMAEILRVAEWDLAEAKKERALRKLGVKREEVKELTPEEEAGARGEVFERLYADLDRWAIKNGIILNEIVDELVPDLEKLAEAVEDGRMTYLQALQVARRLAKTLYERRVSIGAAPPRELSKERKKVEAKTASEIVERRETFPEYVWEYTGKIPEWLKDALSNPKEVGEMLFYGVERHLRGKAEQFPGAEAYADFLAKWLAENVIYKTIKRLEAKRRNLREGLALYLLENYGGVLVEGGMDALYKRAAGWVKYLLKTCSARECGFALKFATDYKVCYSAEDYHKVKVVRKKEPGYTCEPGLYYLMMSAIVEALKTVGGSEADLPEPWRIGYEKFISKMVEEFSRR